MIWTSLSPHPINSTITVKFLVCYSELKQCRSLIRCSSRPPSPQQQWLTSFLFGFSVCLCLYSSSSNMVNTGQLKSTEVNLSQLRYRSIRPLVPIMVLMKLWTKKTSNRSDLWRILSVTLFYFLKNEFYKNIQPEIWPKLKNIVVIYMQLSLSLFQPEVQKWTLL